MLLQEEYESCEQLVELTQAGSVQLVIPAYSFVEPLETLRRRHGERAQLAQSARKQLQLLKRSTSFADAVPDADTVERLFRDSTSLEAGRLREVQDRLLACSTVVPLTAEILESAAQARQRFDLSGQDSVVLASVLSHLDQWKPEEACFINRDSKDFDDPAIVDALDTRRCKLLSRFQDGFGYVTKRIKMS